MVDQELEGLGSVRAYFVELEAPPAEGANVAVRVGETLGTIVRGVPYMLGRAH